MKIQAMFAVIGLILITTHPWDAANADLAEFPECTGARVVNSRSNEFEFCKLELSNKPGCYVKSSDGFRLKATWSGKCKTATAHGEGVYLVQWYNDDGEIKRVKYNGIFKGGVKEDYWILLESNDNYWGTHGKGLYKNGRRYGKWNFGGGGDGDKANGKYNANGKEEGIWYKESSSDGLYVTHHIPLKDGKTHGKWITLTGKWQVKYGEAKRLYQCNIEEYMDGEFVRTIVDNSFQESVPSSCRISYQQAKP